MFLKNLSTDKVQEVLLLKGEIDLMKKIRIAFPDFFPGRNDSPIIFLNKLDLDDYIRGDESFKKNKTYIFFMGHNILDPHEVNHYMKKLAKVGVSQCNYSDMDYLHNLMAYYGNSHQNGCPCSGYDLLNYGHTLISCPFYIPKNKK